MKNPIKLWKDICYRFAQQSKCQSRQVGCVIAQGNHFLGQGYNSAPIGSNCEDCVRCNNKAAPGTQLDLAICAHAEANAIGYCAHYGVRTEDADIYCTTGPCLECAKLIIAAGIKNVYYFEKYEPIETVELVNKMFKNADVGFFKI